jgi:hypothetical protein
MAIGKLLTLPVHLAKPPLLIQVVPKEEFDPETKAYRQKLKEGTPQWTCDCLVDAQGDHQLPRRRQRQTPGFRGDGKSSPSRYLPLRWRNSDQGRAGDCTPLPCRNSRASQEET